MYSIDDLIPSKYVNISKLDNYNDNKSIKEIYKSGVIENFNGNYERINRFLTEMIREKKKVVVFLNDNHIIEDFIKNVSIQTIITSIDNLKSN